MFSTLVYKDKFVLIVKNRVLRESLYENCKANNFFLYFYNNINKKKFDFKRTKLDFIPPLEN